ncbi:MAG: nitroreductase family protein [Acidobacteria bacterium]|nr:nitroreductase family protein [Acidobacteriota bacterium]
MNPHDLDRSKRAAVDHPIHDLLARRWSPRAFDERPVDRELLHQLFEAARWAASSFNEQPWRFLVAERQAEAEFSRMLECLSEGNRAWARRASALAISVSKLAFDRTGKPNRHHAHDVGMATANLAIQATALGLHVHMMAGFDVEKARTTYGVPEGFDPLTAMAIGHLGPIEVLDERKQAREREPRTRLPLTEVVFRERWGNPI